MNSSPPRDIFGPGSNLKVRFVPDYQELALKVEAVKRLGLKVVLTSGTFDLFHIGHSRYFERAKEQGDVLVVGVDSDERVRRRKGPRRPIVPEMERLEIVCHIRHVDLVVLKGVNDPKWHLVKTVQPDVLVITQENYTSEEFTALEEYCGRIAVFEPQATTSTTARIRSLLVGPANDLRAKFNDVSARVAAQLAEARDFIDQLMGGVE